MSSSAHTTFEMPECDMTLDDMVPPVTDLRADFATALEPWRWLIRGDVQPLLLTILGDLFVTCDNAVYFLDTESGRFSHVAPNRDVWKQMLNNPSMIDVWFRPAFIDQLNQSGRRLRAGEVYSPTIPTVLGGKLTVENYTPSQWRMHLHVMGHIHRQVRALPVGTKITHLDIPPF
jgi:hypothetical protein